MNLYYPLSPILGPMNLSSTYKDPAAVYPLSPILGPMNLSGTYKNLVAVFSHDRTVFLDACVSDFSAPNFEIDRKMSFPGNLKNVTSLLFAFLDHG